MQTPHKLSRKLNEVLGNEAADAMVDWLNETDSQIGQLRQELAVFRAEVRADFAELRQEMDSRFAAIDVKFAGFEAKFDARFAAAEVAAARRHEEIMRWMIGFWVLSIITTVGSIIGLSRVLH
jgi:hypothetical protein